MLEFLRAGGPMLWLIIFFGLIGVYVFLEKFFQLRRNQVNVRELVTGLVNVLKRDAMIEAITLCDNTPGPVAKLLNAAIQAYQNEDVSDDQNSCNQKATVLNEAQQANDCKPHK